MDEQVANQIEFGAETKSRIKKLIGKAGLGRHEWKKNSHVIFREFFYCI